MTQNTVPEAYVAVGKNRLKIYSGSIYLKDKQEFQLELFNPTNRTIGAKISINGNYISQSMLVLKPGERTYLERFLDENRKFLFETYEVEDTKQVKKAIEDNGNVRIEFYNERQTVVYNNGNGTITINRPAYPFNTFFTGSSSGFAGSSSGVSGNSGPVGSRGIVGTTYDCTFATNSSNATYTSSTLGVMDMMSMETSNTKSMETGRVEKGKASDQDFGIYYGEFETFYSSVVDYKLLPESRKPIESKEIRRYCGNCGTRVKKDSHKFCYNCGDKI